MAKVGKEVVRLREYKYVMENGYFRKVLLDFINIIIKRCNGLEIEDVYAFNRFVDGKWIYKIKDDADEEDWLEMDCRNYCVDDLADEILFIVEGIKEKYDIKIEMDLKINLT